MITLYNTSNSFFLQTRYKTQGKQENKQTNKNKHNSNASCISEQGID